MPSDNRSYTKRRYLCDLGHAHRTEKARQDCKRRYVNRKLHGKGYRGRRSG